MHDLTTAQQWVLLLIMAAPSAFSLYAAIMAHRVKRDVKQLEINTNSKMDALLKASVGEAAAIGENKGRADEAARAAAAAGESHGTV